jgi:hypothetical protein
MESLTARMFETARTVGLPLDMELSCTQTLEDGTVCVTASVDAFPKTKEEQSLSQTALYAALLEDFSDIQKVDVRVFVPPVANCAVTSTTTDVVLASQRIRAWNDGVHDFAVKAALQFAFSSYTCVVETYPWVEKDAMRARIPAAIQQTIANMSTGLPDPLMTNQCVDYILPPLETVMRHEETTCVYHDVTRLLGGTPDSIIQFYEVIFLCGTHHMAVSDTTLSVFHRVFQD